MINYRFQINQIGRPGSLRVGGDVKNIIIIDSAISACSYDKIDSESRVIL